MPSTPVALPNTSIHSKKRKADALGSDTPILIKQIGVYKRGSGKYQVKLILEEKGKQVSFGTFSTYEEAVSKAS